MRRIERIHQPDLRQAQGLTNTLPAGIGKQAGDQRFGRIIAIGHRPMAGDDGAGTGADKGAHQAIEGKIAAGCHPGVARGGGGRGAGGIARRKDDRIGIERQVENLAERKQSVRSGLAKGGEQRRPRRAFRARRCDKAMGGKMDDTEITKVRARHQRRIGKGSARHHFGRAATDEVGTDGQFHRRNRVAPFAQRPVTPVTDRTRASRDHIGPDIFTKPKIGAAATRRRLARSGHRPAPATARQSDRFRLARNSGH